MLGVACAETLAARQTLGVGAAKVDITPDPQLTNWVGHKPYDGVLDRLFVRALALSDGSHEFLVLAYDLTDVREPFVARVRRAVGAELGVAEGRILVHASHTHSAPWSPAFDAPLVDHERQALGPVERDPLFPAWSQRLLEASVQVARRARAAQRPATVVLGRADVAEVLFNRRPRRPDGSVETIFEPADPRVLPNGLRLGPLDPTLTVLAWRDAEQRTIATMFHLPCHPVAIYPYHKGLSADWPGETAKRIETALGGEAIFLQGCGGDIVPARRGVAAREVMGKLVAERALAAVRQGLPLPLDALRSRSAGLDLPLTDAARRDTGRETFTTEVQVLACGPLALAGLPGEPLLDLSTAIQQRSPFPHTLVLGYSNGGGVQYVGLPGEKARGGYEMGEVGLGTDECGERLVATAARLLAELNGAVGQAGEPSARAGQATDRAGAAPKVEARAQGRGRMKLLSKEVFFRNQDKRPFAAGFVTYLSATQPLLIHCFGREDYSDGYDDYAVSLSEDNGRTWTEPVVRWRSRVVPEGRFRYGEPAAFFDADQERLMVLINHTLYPNDQFKVDAEHSLELNLYDPARREWTERRALAFPGQRTPAMSFSFPIKTARGRLLFPGMRPTVDAAGRAIYYRNTWAPVDEVVTVIGEWPRGGALTWRLGQPLTIAPEISSRGLDENTLAELPDGRIAAICRGDNSAFPDQPGYKWLSFSSDDGQTWSAPVPLPATGGDPIESGANGSALFRSIKNGRLYWMGNLALRGERPKGNWPRSPLVMVEVQEAPFALKRDTMFVVDERGHHDSPRVQLSNFRFYQDRETGDVVIFLTRYGEHSETEWMDADYYRYRVAMP